MWRKEKSHAGLIEKLRIRMVFSCVFGVVIFLTITYRLTDVMIFNRPSIIGNVCVNNEENPVLKADIRDRNGEIIATCVSTASCYADPSVVIDQTETAEKLSKIKGFPTKEKILSKLSDKKKHFVWITRHVTPKLQQDIMDLGIPGVFFKKDYKRVYPNGNLFSHVVGCTDIDGNGICGIEKSFNEQLIISNISEKSLFLTLDMRIQAIVREELKEAIDKFKAIGGNAVVMKVNGEILSMVSMPDFDPNNLRQEDVSSMFNRNTLGAYEPGSTFKILNVAIALESGSAKLNSMFDATTPIKIGRFSVKDFRGKNRALSLAEAFVFSSNIASVKISQTFGTEVQKSFMKKFGIFDKINLELPEVGNPIFPKRWSEATSWTVSYGYGVSVSPLQLIASVSSIVNKGIKTSPTLLLNSAKHDNIRLISEETSSIVRELMRAVVIIGTAKKANVEGVEIFGKTGTAYKTSKKGYGNDSNRARITTFLGGFPKNNPKYMIIIMLDDPKPAEGTFGYSTAGWNAAPTGGKILQRIVPILGDGIQEIETELKVAKYIQS